MSTLIRNLKLFADGQEIAQGCPMNLDAKEKLTLRPALHSLDIRGLSESSQVVLSSAKSIEVRSGDSVLAFGEPMNMLTRITSGRRITSLMFAPGFSFWKTSVALSVPAGMKVRDTILAVLRSTGTNTRLAAFAAEDRTIYRPQAFFGRACDALSLLSETVDADAYLSAAGLCISGRSAREQTITIPEIFLLSDPIRTGNRLLIATSMLGWPLGAFARVSCEGASWTGRLVSRYLQADNRNGPWKSELEMELL